MRLYEFGPTRSIRVRWTLQELGIDFESVEVDLPKGAHQHPDFLKLNPAGKIPVLVDGEVIVTESVAIVLYLAEKHPEKRLLPSDLAQRAQVYRWLLFAATELEQPLWRIARHTSLLAEADRRQDDIELARRDFARMAAVLEEHLRGRQWVASEDVSVADFVTAYTLDWANEVGLLERCPTLRTYMERMYARPKAAPRIAVAMARLAM